MFDVLACGVRGIEDEGIGEKEEKWKEIIRWKRGEEKEIIYLKENSLLCLTSLHKSHLRSLVKPRACRNFALTDAYIIKALLLLSLVEALSCYSWKPDPWSLALSLWVASKNIIVKSWPSICIKVLKLCVPLSGATFCAA